MESSATILIASARSYALNKLTDRRSSSAMLYQLPREVLVVRQYRRFGSLSRYIICPDASRETTVSAGGLLDVYALINRPARRPQLRGHLEFCGLKSTVDAIGRRTETAWVPQRLRARLWDVLLVKIACQWFANVHWNRVSLEIRGNH